MRHSNSNNNNNNSPSRASWMQKNSIPTSKPHHQSLSTHSKKFNPDQFKVTDFSSGQYIDNLTQTLVEQQTAHGDDFDATAFKTLLDDNLEFLEELAAETDEEMESLVEQCSAAERTFQSQISDLAINFETNFTKFSKLDARINKVGSSAARIGDRLEVVDIQQKRATDAVGCIKYFLELNNTDSKRSAIFTDSNKVHELAHLIKKLSGIAQELDLQSLSKGKMATEIIGSNIENELLEHFSKADAAKDYDQMKEYANTLTEFSGGDSCIQRYISTRDMFLSPISLAKDESVATDTSMRRVTDSILVDNRLDDFYMDIVKTVEEEDDIINKVFPSPTVVMSELIKRIFEQRVRMFIELMLQQDLDDDPLLYLRTLCLALTKTKDVLVLSLKKYSSFGVDFGTLVNSVFCNYQDEYIEKELSYMIGLFQQTLLQIRTAPEYDTEDKDEERGFVLATVGKLLTSTEDAVERAKILSADDRLAQNVQRLFNALIKYLGYDYIDDLLNIASKLPSASDPRFLSGLQTFFSLVATSTSAVLLIQRHFQLVTLPLVSSSVNEYTQCYEVLGSLMGLLENKISDGMNNSMQSLLICMDRILAEQKKDDFKFKDEATEYSNDPTKVCQICVKFIRNLYDSIIDTLDGRNIEIFLEEFGLNVQRLLLTHFKKFKIGKGGLKLMRDLAEYKDALKLFQITAVDEACEVLTEISKLHLIAPENLKTVIEEGVLSRMDKNEVLAFVRLRDDYKSTWVGKYV